MLTVRGTGILVSKPAVRLNHYRFISIIRVGHFHLRSHHSKVHGRVTQGVVYAVSAELGGIADTRRLAEMDNGYEFCPGETV